MAIRIIRTWAAILASGFKSNNLLANLAAVAVSFALVNTWIALQSAICKCAGWRSQCVKYAASSRLRRTSSGFSCATRRRSSSILTPRRYSRAAVSVSRHYGTNRKVSFVSTVSVGRKRTYLFCLVIRGQNHEQQRLKLRAESSLCFRKPVTGYETEAF